MPNRLPLFNLPNALTLSRFALAPVVLVLVGEMRNPEEHAGAWKVSFAVILVLLVTFLTDLFDGMLARARKEVTNFGKIMDPVADSTFFLTLLFGLSACRRFGEEVSLWFPMLVLYREIAMHILRRYAALKGHAMPAKMSGKIKMFTQAVLTLAFFLLVLARDWLVAFYPGSVLVSETFLRSFVFCLCIYIVGVTYWSLIEYSRDVPDLIAEYGGHAEPAGDPAKTEDARPS